MDKEFWTQVYKNKFEVPEGYALSDLTRELFSYLGDPDPELRDDISYTVYANWLKQGRYSATELYAHITELLANLETGIGENETDSVFLRAFSALFLAEIIHNDNKKSFLKKTEVRDIFEKTLAYLAAEKDPRGYVHSKGWAHALAHTADLLFVLAKNKNLEAADLSRILTAISDKMINATSHLYVDGEDERLASAVIQVLQRDLLSIEELKHWAIHFIEHDWKGVYMHEGHNCAFQNTRNLLRSIYLELRNEEHKLPKHNEIELIFLEVLRNFKPY